MSGLSSLARTICRSGDYYALRMINERFARMARQVFLPMLRIQPRISSFPPEVKTFDEYTAGIENFMSLNISRIEELRGSMLAVLSPTFISVLTNSYYGGKIKALATTRSEFTATRSVSSKSSARPKRHARGGMARSDGNKHPIYQP